MASTESINNWVNEFGMCVVKQDEAIGEHDPNKGNDYAARRIELFRNLRSAGDVGLDALATLLRDERLNVRTMAACYLIRHNTDEALAVLKSSAQTKGITGFGAMMTLKNWENGTWDLDKI